MLLNKSSYKTYFTRYFFLVIVILTNISYVSGQGNNALLQQNLSSVKIDNLSDAQIIEYSKQAQASGLTQDQLETIALSRGLSAVELDKLKVRLAALQNTTNTTDNSGKVIDEGSNRQLIAPETDVMNFNNAKTKSKIFGAALFNNTNLTFEPNLRIPTPKNYQLGPDDELVIDIYGFSQANYKVRVSPEGAVNLSGIGLIYVNGLTVEQASQKIKGMLAQFYEGMTGSNPSTFAQISLGNIRSIKITMLGNITRPGSYTISSLSTLFNALYVSGGPDENGSFRNIELIRNNKTILKLDIYDFLLRGDQKNNIRLQDQDIIKVNPYDVRVEISGYVKMPGVFEIKPGETLNDLIGFAGGFTDEAYTDLIKVRSNTAKGRKIFDITKVQFASYIPAKGDIYTVDKILERFENRVTINGAVFRAGAFALKDGYTVKQLIDDAGGLKEDAFMQRGTITRLKDNLEAENVSFDVAKLMNGEISDISLKREDVVNIYSVFELRESYFVQIAGQVNGPGTFPYVDNMNLEDLILKASGLKDAASTIRVEISRRFKDGNPTSPSGQQAEVFLLDINPDLSENNKTKSFLLKPFDIVYVRTSPGYEVQRQIIVSGEVTYPGWYTIRKKSDRISDAIIRAGGVTALAYIDGATLIRKSSFSQEEVNLRNKRYQQYKASINDSTASAFYFDDSYVGINLRKIIQKPGSKYDLLLKEGDIIRIPQQLQTIEIKGAVLYPISVRYDNGFSCKYYISSAGGFTDNARKNKSFVIYANGQIKRTKNYIFFKDYPKIKPGAQIIVPQKEIKRRNSSAENIAIMSGISSITLAIIAIANLLK